MSSATHPGEFESSSSPGTIVLARLDAWVLRGLRMLASLRLTCVLFLLGIFIVFVGSLAQSRRDINPILKQYFRTFAARIDIPDLFPPSLFGSFALANGVDDYGIMVADKFESWFGTRSIYVPGGWTIGWLMLANLVAAHSLKFRVTASGQKLAVGIGLIVLSLAMIALVVVTGNQQTGVEFGNTLLSVNAIWWLMLGMLTVTGGAAVAASVLQKSASTSLRIVLGTIGFVFLAVTLYFVVSGESGRLNLWSMRILWQLLKGSACSLVLLIGANLIFGKRGGIAVIHLGVALLMIGELWVGMSAKENMLRLAEGESSNFVRDIRETELAIMTDGDQGREKVVVIPSADLTNALPPKVSEGESSERGPAIMIKSLPFDVSVRSFLTNSELRGRRPGDEKLTSPTGSASFAVAEARDPVTGMEEDQDQPSVLIDLIDRSTNMPMHSLLVSQKVSEFTGSEIAEVVTVDGKEYRFYLRWQRNYRDYDVKLKDVSSTTYVGSSTPKDFRSEIEISDKRSGKTETFTLWMNNPLRYQGETFYQSSYQKMPDESEVTTLSVVNNEGWMLPYIACMVVTFGMFAQFGSTLSRFLNRAARSAVGDGDEPTDSVRPGFGPARREKLERLEAASSSMVATWGIPALVVVLCTGWLFSKAREPKPVDGAFQLSQFAKLPIAWSGRAQPIDSMARTQLLMASHKSTFEGELEAAELAQPERREMILKAFSAEWPAISQSDLEKIEGSYPEWIKTMSELTSSGEAAIEARLRPLMTVKMPAVRWLLDVVTRPSIAARHRVIRIDNDQLLSALGLEKRPGLTYSPAEVLPKIQELDEILQSARKKQTEKKSSLLTTDERRVLSLGDTLMRINDLQQLFQVHESDGLVESLVEAWRIWDEQGESPAVNAVPTGSEIEKRAWETVVYSNAVQQFGKELDAAGIKTLDDLKAHLRDKLSLQTVRESVTGSYTILQNLPADPSASEPATVQQRAAERVDRIDDLYLREILAIIAAADPKATAEEIAASVTPERAREVATERYSSLLFRVFESIQRKSPDDPRLKGIRERLQRLNVTDTRVLTAAMTDELLTLVWDDVQKRAGELLPGGKCHQTFEQSTTMLAGVLAAWKDGDVQAFNSGLESYQKLLSEVSIPHLQPRLVQKEAWFNAYDPFYKAICIYLPVILISFIGWLFWGTTLRHVSLSLLVLGFIVHSMALYWRMEFSGRPPVTNLYSSAIFIGWAAIIAAFMIERIMKNGVGNVLGASIGAATLTIAHYLAREESRSLDGGDNLGVMQAVLDTTFWLATHVVCITLGYAATFLAGFIGLLYCVQAVTGGSFGMGESGLTRAENLKLFGKLTYGTLCFAIFFSLVGTVLGGLWADDSWGRFWGWDPKENGALMIVLWNALVLHARWDKIVGDYGTAVLTMVGNAVTAWSWFGVNGLQAGLHSYGFTEGRLYALGVFILVQMLVVAFFAALSRHVSRRVLVT